MAGSLPARAVLLGLVLLAAAAAAAPAPGPGTRRLLAARRQGPVAIDGVPDEPAWAAAEVASGFTQVVPDEGAPASLATRVRVLWDEEALYFAVECDDPEPPTLILNRRDRAVEGDSISVVLDSELDRRTAYRFTVYAAGQQLDGLHYDDSSFGTEWDAAWESAVAVGAAGWSAELRIPLRVLRLPDGLAAMGLDLVRVVARRHEESHWQFVPRDLPGVVSRLGTLTGLEGIRPVPGVELRPYLAAKAALQRPAPADALAPLRAGPCSSGGLSASAVGTACVGLDLRAALTPSLSLVGALNPDFGQVEADQRVLNLSTFETFFPEKRPFFLEGLDLFQSPVRMTDWGGQYGGDAFQLFYSRRVGSSLLPPDLPDGTRLLYQPASRQVAGALKLAGSAGPLTLAALGAVEPSVSAQVLDASGAASDLQLGAAAWSGALRARARLADGLLLGATATARDPLYSPGARHAHAGALDLAAFDASSDWKLAAQIAGTLLTGGAPVTERDGTVLRDGATGVAAQARLAKDAGPVTGFVDADLLSPGFEVNDLGFANRANLFRSFAAIAFRDLHPSDRWQRAQVTLSARSIHDARLATTLYRDLVVQPEITFGSFWTLLADAIWIPARGDDRELGDGTPLVQHGGYGGVLQVGSDPNRPAAATLQLNGARLGPGWSAEAYLTTTLRPASRVEAQLELDYAAVAGEVRRLRGATTVPGGGAGPEPLDPAAAQAATRLYLLAPQDVHAFSALLRATLALSPRLTLQAWAQLFLQGIHWGEPLRAVVAPGRGEVRVDALTPALPDDRAPQADLRSAGLDVNLILRWEWRLGSALYLVYAHRSEGNARPGVLPLSLAGDAALLGGSAQRGDTLLLKLDLLAAP